MTEKQKMALAFIRERIAGKGYPPSYEEIMRHLGLRSKSGVHRIVHALIDRGYLTRETGYARSIALPSGEPEWERMRRLLSTKRPTMQTFADLRVCFGRLDRIPERAASQEAA